MKNFLVKLLKITNKKNFLVLSTNEKLSKVVFNVLCNKSNVSEVFRSWLVESLVIAVDHYLDAPYGNY